MKSILDDLVIRLAFVRNPDDEEIQSKDLSELGTELFRLWAGGEIIRDITIEFPKDHSAADYHEEFSSLLTTPVGANYLLELLTSKLAHIVDSLTFANSLLFVDYAPADQVPRIAVATSKERLPAHWDGSAFVDDRGGTGRVRQTGDNKNSLLLYPRLYPVDTPKAGQLSLDELKKSRLNFEVWLRRYLRSILKEFLDTINSATLTLLEKASSSIVETTALTPTSFAQGRDGVWKNNLPIETVVTSVEHLAYCEPFTDPSYFSLESDPKRLLTGHCGKVFDFEVLCTGSEYDTLSIGHSWVSTFFCSNPKKVGNHLILEPVTGYPVDKRIFGEPVVGAYFVGQYYSTCHDGGSVSVLQTQESVIMGTLNS